MSYRSPLLVLACVAVAGCAAPKQSRDEMLAANLVVTRVCSGLSVAEAAERLKSAWQACFMKPPSINVIPLGTTTAVYTSSRLMVTEDSRGGMTTLFTLIAPQRFAPPSPFSRSILLMADLRETAECRAEVQVRPATDDWKAPADYTARWLQEPVVPRVPPPCPAGR